MDMITIKQEHVASIPVLHIAQEQDRLAQLPLVFFIHGYTSAKEHNLHYAYLLAEKGYRVILPDVVYHGEREGSIDYKTRELKFWEMVVQSIKEIGVLKEEFERKSLILDGLVGMAGTSMGGIITYGALAKYPWIKAAASLMGTPYYQHFANEQIKALSKQGIRLDEQEIQMQINALAEYDLSVQMDSLKQRPLFIWHGEEDNVVPYPYSKKFYEQVQALYQTKRENLAFMSEKSVDHKVSRSGIQSTVEWFDKKLV